MFLGRTLKAARVDDIQFATITMDNRAGGRGFEINSGLDE
jgi:hypothetical protein